MLSSWMVTLSSWQIISFKVPPKEFGCVYAWAMLESGPAIDLQKMPILAKKIIFSNEAHFNLGGYVNKQYCRIWGTENPHSYIEKSTHPKRVTVWCEFWSRGIIGPFFFENEQGEAITMAIVIGPCWTHFCSQKLKRRILATFVQHNVLKNCTDRVGYCMASRGSQLNEIIFQY